MGQTSDNPYTSQSISGYNSSPPPDDASVQSSNKLEWAKHKTKLADPVKTLTEAVNTQVLAMGALLVNTATGVRNQVSGSLGFAWGTATIETDVITPDSSAVAVGAESGATSDTLQVLETTSVYDGAILHLRALAASEEIELIHATSTRATATGANIYLLNGADARLNDPAQIITMQYESNTASGWVQQSRSNGGLHDLRLTATADVTLTNSYNNVMLDVDTSDGDVTLTLPATPATNMNFSVAFSDADNTIILDGNGNNVNTATSATLVGFGEMAFLHWNGSTWHLTRSQPSSGRFELLETATLATAVAQVDIGSTATDWSAYERVVIECNEVVPSTNNSFFQMQFRNATATGPVASGYQYAWDGQDDAGTALSNNASANSAIVMTEGVQGGSATNFHLSGTIDIFNVHRTADPYCSWNYAYGVATNNIAYTVGGGYGGSNADLGGARLLFSAGNVAQGDFYVWGVRKRVT